MTYDNKGSELD